MASPPAHTISSVKIDVHQYEGAPDAAVQAEKLDAYHRLGAPDANVQTEKLDIYFYIGDTCPPPGPFTGASVGDVVQVKCGKVQLTEIVSDFVAYGEIIQEEDILIPDDPVAENLPIAPGWSIATPVTTVSGLDHLEGKIVMALADGLVQGPFTVSGGAITLPHAATNIIVGLAYSADLQDLRATTGEQLVSEGKRKQVSAVTLRLDNALGLLVGPDFDNLSPVPGLLTPSPYTPPAPLISNDTRALVQAQWNTEGQIAIRQPYPLPATVLGIYKEITLGDDNG